MHNTHPYFYREIEWSQVGHWLLFSVAAVTAATMAAAAIGGHYSRHSLSMCILQLPTSKGRVHVRYLTQGSIRINRRRWVKALTDSSSWSKFVDASANARRRVRHADACTDASAGICGRVLVVHIHGHVRECTRTRLSLLRNWQAD